MRKVRLITPWYAEELLGHGQGEHVRLLLNDDVVLIDEAKAHVDTGQKKTMNLCQTVQVLERLGSYIERNGQSTLLDILQQALSGDLLHSALIDDTLDAMERLSSDRLLSILHDLLTPSSIAIDDATLKQNLASLSAEIENLVKENGNKDTPLRSEYASNHDTITTTVVHQRVKLSKKKAKISALDKKYTTLIVQVRDLLSGFFKEYLINPTELFMNEIFIYDLKSPNTQAFTPEPRFALERALSVPFDYLSCDCCETAEGSLSPSQPPSAILYQLYLESGSLVNLFDLWKAFEAIVGVDDAGEGGVETSQGGRMTLALFYRGLAELKSMGMVRGSRKKIDHLARLAWKSL